MLEVILYFSLGVYILIVFDAILGLSDDWEYYTNFDRVIYVTVTILFPLGIVIALCYVALLSFCEFMARFFRKAADYLKYY